MAGNKIVPIALSLVLLGAGCLPSTGPRPPAVATTQEAVYMLVAIEDTTTYDRAPVETTFGCGDRLLLQRITVPKSDRPALEVNLNALFDVRHDEAGPIGLYTPFGGQNLRAEVTEEDGKIIVNITPFPISAGTCDDPRITELVEQTAKLSIGSVPEIRIEGSHTKWRCYGDQSGLCR